MKVQHAKRDGMLDLHSIHLCNIVFFTATVLHGGLEVPTDFLEDI